MKFNVTITTSECYVVEAQSAPEAIEKASRAVRYWEEGVESNGSGPTTYAVEER